MNEIDIRIILSALHVAILDEFTPDEVLDNLSDLETLDHVKSLLNKIKEFQPKIASEYNKLYTEVENTTCLIT